MVLLHMSCYPPQIQSSPYKVYFYSFYELCISLPRWRAHQLFAMCYSRLGGRSVGGEMMRPKPFWAYTPNGVFSGDGACLVSLKAGSHMVVRFPEKCSAIVTIIWKQLNLCSFYDRWTPRFYLDDCDVNYTRMRYILTASFQDGGKLQYGRVVTFYRRSETQRLFEWQIFVRVQT